MLNVDFGLREVSVKRLERQAVFGGDIVIDCNEKIKDNFCYRVTREGLEKIAFFSENTQRFYKLIPTADWPTLGIGSVPMHALASPKKDTENKIAFLKPYGCVLDTCMGLGYTAIAAAKKAKQVITFERDENVRMIAEMNPLSQELFTMPGISIIMEDVSEGIKKFPDNFFDCIVHDPPTFKLSPGLYANVFYKELLRVLKKGGRAFHYTPLYKISQGYDFPAKIKVTLKEAGFRIVDFSLKQGGVVCTK